MAVVEWMKWKLKNYDNGLGKHLEELTETHTQGKL